MENNENEEEEIVWDYQPHESKRALSKKLNAEIEKQILLEELEELDPEEALEYLTELAEDGNETARKILREIKKQRENEDENED